ncbi:MAG: SHOCT domain-containing protein [Candidatus Paceibacterota bacterium]|jgi:putative membrane protein
MMYYYDYSFFPFHAFGAVFMLALWALIIYGVITLLRRQPRKGDGRAIDILKERYAKGEITKHEFDAMKKDLE